jgi:hypothetical protein
MARILAKGEWYDPISQTALYEQEYESIILQEAPNLFPQYRTVPFKVIVDSEDGSAKADLALVHKDYKKWWVCEVELAEHSFENHVEPQVRKLSRAEYGQKVAQHLCSQCTGLEEARVFAMLKGAQPLVLVVVNQQMDQWKQCLRRYDARVVFVEVFRSDFGHQVYLVNGDEIAEDQALLTRCVVDGMIRNMLRVESPGALPVRPGEPIEIRFGGGVAVWERADVSDTVFLIPRRTPNLQCSTAYDLIQQDDGELVLRPETAPRTTRKRGVMRNEYTT